jgi:hypothetical protein
VSESLVAGVELEYSGVGNAIWEIEKSIELQVLSRRTTTKRDNKRRQVAQSVEGSSLLLLLLLLLLLSSSSSSRCHPGRLPHTLFLYVHMFVACFD